DSDDDCPATLGPSLLARAYTIRPDVPIGVVIAKMPGGAQHDGRYCRGCDTWHAREDFSFKDVRRRTLRSRCRTCCREASRRHYARMKVHYLERNRRNSPRQRQAAAEFVYQFLLAHPCVECGEADPVVLEFNQVDPTTKSANISDMIANGASLAYLRPEIAK